MLRYSLAALGLLAGVLLIQPPGAGATELIANGGFESRTDSWGTTDGALDTVPFPVHGGTAAGRLTGTYLQTHEVYQWLDVQAGGSYSFGGWVYLDDPGAARAFLKIRWLASNASPISDEQSVPLTIHKPGYQPITTGAVTAPAWAVRARFGVLVEPAGPFTVYLDDFSIDGPAPGTVTTPVPTPALTSAPSPAGTNSPSPSRAPKATSTPAPTPTGMPVEVPSFFAALANGGFEHLDADGLPYGWRKFGGQVSSVGEPRAEGRRALLLSSSTTSTKWAYQAVSVEPGAYYQASVSALKNDAASESVFLRLSWYATPDGGGSAIGSADSVDLLETDAPSFRTLSTGAVQAPAGARSVRVRLTLRPVSDAPAAAFFDDVRLTRVPPPQLLPATTAEGRATRTARHAVEVLASPAAAPAARGAVFTPVVPANVRTRPTPAPMQTAGAGGGLDWLSYASLTVALAALAFAGFSHVRRRAGRAGE